MIALATSTLLSTFRIIKRNRLKPVMAMSSINIRPLFTGYPFQGKYPLGCSQLELHSKVLRCTEHLPVAITVFRQNLFYRHGKVIALFLMGCLWTVTSNSVYGLINHACFRQWPIIALHPQIRCVVGGCRQNTFAEQLSGAKKPLKTTCANNSVCAHSHQCAHSLSVPHVALSANQLNCVVLCTHFTAQVRQGQFWASTTLLAMYR